MFSNKPTIYIYIYIYRTYGITVSKKLLLLLIFSFGLFNLNLQEVYSQSNINWSEHTPPPCSNVFNSERDDIPWTGPKTLRVCPNGPLGCCFTIVYHDKMFNVSGGASNLRCDKKYDYDVSITEIFYESESCKNYNKDNLINFFLDKLYRENSLRKGFRDSLTKCCDMSIPNSYGYVQTRFKCLDGNNIPCVPNIEGCCNTYKRMLFQSVGDDCVYVGIDNTFATDLVGPDCDTNCTAKCNEVLMENIGKLACEMPCDSGEVNYFTEEVIIDPACPECKFTVTYKMNNTYCHPFPNYMDFEIVGITYNPIPCSLWPCNLAINSENLYIYAMNYILNNFVVNYNLDRGKCIENIRVIKSPCFKNITLPTGNVSLQPCEQEYCCILNVKICKSFTGQITYEYVELNNNQESCPSENNQVCLPYCFEDLLVNPINIIKFDKTNENNKFKKEYKNEK